MLAERLATHDELSIDDLGELASFLDRPTASQAIRAYRAALVARQ